MSSYQAARYVQRAQQRLDAVTDHIASRDSGDALRTLTSALWCVSAAAAELVAWQRDIGCTWAHIAAAAGTDISEAMRCWAQPARGLLRTNELDRRRRLREQAAREQRVLTGAVL